MKNKHRIKQGLLLLAEGLRSQIWAQRCPLLQRMPQPPETAQAAPLDPDALNSGDRTVTVIPKSVRRRLPPHR